MPDLGDISVKSITIRDGGTIRTQDGTEFILVSPSVARIVYAPAPSASDGAALGSATLQWSDLFLAPGAVINVSNGNVTLTFSTLAMALSGLALTINSQSVALNVRTRNTVAQVNAGATLLAAVTGLKYRLIDCKMIAVGGAVGAVTTIDVKATQSAGAAILVSFAQASLTQSTVLTAGGSGATVLADGASYIKNDAGTAITIIKAGSDITTATSIDTILTYALEA